MSLRRRLTLLTAAAVGLAVAVAVAVAYIAVRDELRSQVDESLSAQRALVLAAPAIADGRRLPAPPPRAGDSAGYAQVVDADGSVRQRLRGAALPVSDGTRGVAAGRAPASFADVEVDGAHVRILTFRRAGEGAFQLGRSLEGVDAVLARLRLILGLVIGGGVALAVALGALVSRRAIAPLARVTETAQHIAKTHDVGRRIEVGARDEVGRLAERFNEMLDSLQAAGAAVDRAAGAQRQLVADASHELRTPITSLRTNIEVLVETPELPDAERRMILRDVREQSEELSALVADLIELARGDAPARLVEQIRLDALVEEAVGRARLHAPHVQFRLDAVPALLMGDPDRVGRAVNNLLDNAAKYSDGQEPVDVRVDLDGLVVRDYGPGIASDDLEHVFDRFYRGTGSRGRQGTGLGLAIVKQVAETHGGAVRAANPPGGGALLELRLPARSPAH